MSTTATGAIPILRIGKTLLASIQVSLRDAIAEAFQEDVLNAIAGTRAKALLIDVTGLTIIDSYVARLLVETAEMANLMGAVTVLAGMRPEIAATLVRMGFRVRHIQTALDLEDGLALARRLGKRKPR